MLIKFALRNLKKRPILNGIKIIGLGLGLCGLLFIALFIKNELGYDQQQKNADRIYRLTFTSPDFLENNHFARFFASQELPKLAENVPEIEEYVRLQPIRGKLIRNQEQYYGINQGFAVDESFFKVFDIQLLQGQTNAITNPGSVVISTSLAQKVFGNSDPIGKVISLPEGHFNATQSDFEVAGVMQDFVQQSHFHPDILFIPGNDRIEGWAYLYLLLKENTNVEAVAGKLSKELALLFTPQGATDNVAVKAYLMNIADIHLKSNLFREIEPNGSLSNIWVLAIAGFVLLFISISNFTSLNLGMVGYLSTFLALNQIMGSSKRIIGKYLIIESTIVVLLAVALVFLGMFHFNTLISENYQIDLLKGNWLFTIIVILCCSLLILLAGLQPIVKNRFVRLSLNQSLHKTGKVKAYNPLLIAQFTLVIILLIGVVVISKQINYGLDKAMGANENIICLPLVHSEVQKDFLLFKKELLKQTDITSVSAMMDTPGSETHDMFQYAIADSPKPKDGNNAIGVFAADYSFAEVFGLSFLGGKNFTERNTDENGNGEYIINESALRQLGFQDPSSIVDKAFQLISPVEGVDLPEGRIIGVVEDFHLAGLQSKVEPLVIFKRENSWLNSIVISYKSKSQNGVTQSIQNIWDDLFPEYPLDYVEVDTIYQNVYKTELLQKRLILIFSSIAIFISIMGVLGLSLMVSKSRYKEIGIRKVNGASRIEILTLLNSAFFKCLILALILAMPIAYVTVSAWLKGFAYSIPLTPSMFLLAGGSVVLITILTVSWQSYKAASVNPVKSLRTE
ncbi:ABC transporter permease [Maribacter aurantiacus]|uniref:FtsX-like permease family protein n=1 Tax=Maribacter aurantiacus TaxID=1882343 RepID=A0A5R8MBG2_9FLAO|nr:ABC transporter permease [Maribacter aurantiacus]TLF46840.1 FtsX-like permease family protein [Maribacter aurantiacus]